MLCASRSPSSPAVHADVDPIEVERAARHERGFDVQFTDYECLMEQGAVWADIWRGLQQAEEALKYGDEIYGSRREE